MRYGKTRVYKDNKWTEVDVKTDIKCNLCGHSCYLGLNRFLRDNHIETGGLINAHDLELSKEDWDVQRHQFHPVRTDDILLTFRYYKDPEHTILHRANGPAVESFWDGDEYWIDEIKQPDPEKS